MAACSPAGPTSQDHTDPGLRQAVQVVDRDIVELGIVFANLVLGAETTFRFQPTWSKACWYAPRIKFSSDASGRRHIELRPPPDLQIEFFNFEAIPVYLSDDDLLADEDVSFVPDQRRCVVININAVPKVLRWFGLQGRFAPPQVPSYEKARPFAVIVMHEAGHLAHGDSGSYAGGANNLPLAAMQQDDPQIAKEIAADQFVIDELDNQLDRHEAVGEDFWDRTRIAASLHRVIEGARNTNDLEVNWPRLSSKLPWELQPKEDLSALSSRSYSHINLFLRFEVMAYQLDPTVYFHDRLKRVLGPQIDTTFRSRYPLRSVRP